MHMGLYSLARELWEKVSVHLNNSNAIKCSYALNVTALLKVCVPLNRRFENRSYSKIVNGDYKVKTVNVMIKQISFHIEVA